MLITTLNIITLPSKQTAIKAVTKALAKNNFYIAIIKKHYSKVYKAYSVLKNINNIKAIKKAKAILNCVKAILIFNKSNKTNRCNLIF